MQKNGLIQCHFTIAHIILPDSALTPSPFCFPVQLTSPTLLSPVAWVSHLSFLSGTTFSIFRLSCNCQMTPFVKLDN